MQDDMTLTTLIEAERVDITLPETLRDLLLPFYALFDFFEPHSDFFATETARMTRRKR